MPWFEVESKIQGCRVSRLTVQMLTIGDVVEGEWCTACSCTSTGHPDLSLEGGPLVISELIGKTRCLHNQYILFNGSGSKV